MIALAASLGGVSMAAFMVFLFAGPPGWIELDLSLWGDVATNTGLSLLFFMQHSGMVRQPFRIWLARSVPEHYVGAIYSIASGIVLLIVVLIFGTKKLRVMGADLGSAFRGFRKAVNEGETEQLNHDAGSTESVNPSRDHVDS